MRYQKPIRNREPISAGTLGIIKRRVQALANEHDCSKSFVINTILADRLDVELEERYYDIRKDSKKARNRTR